MSQELSVNILTSCLLHELGVTFCIRVTSYCLLHELRVNFLNMSYNKDKDDKAAYDNKVMIRNYSLGLFFDKRLGAS